jgi:hypothetical protein
MMQQAGARLQPYDNYFFEGVQKRGAADPAPAGGKGLKK